MLIAGVTPLPRTRLSFLRVDGELVPAWLGDRDRPWLRDLLAEAEAFVGRQFEELTTHWRRSEADPRAGSRRGAAVHVLDYWLRSCAETTPRSAIRRELFPLVASGISRAHALAQVASRHGIGVDTLTRTLYDDLPQQRRVRWPQPALDPSGLALAANLALVRGMLRFATSAQIRVRGASRALLKTAWLHGAQPTVQARPFAELTLSWQAGPTATRSTALPAMVALLPWSRRFVLRAQIELPRARGELVVATGDPILPGPEPRLYDSQLERTFERDFRRLLPTWRILREPTALVTPAGIAFPDFELRPPEPGEPWLCEIAGLRDPAALMAKVQLLTSCARLVLCLPRRHVPDALRGHPRIVEFGRRVPAPAVAKVVAGVADGPSPDQARRHLNQAP